MFSLHRSLNTQSFSIEKSYSSELEQEVTREFADKFQARTQQNPVLILVGGFQGSGKSSLIEV